MPQTTLYALVMLAAGVGIPLLAVLNAGLGKSLDSPVAASAVLFCVALVLAWGALFLSGDLPKLARVSDAPKPFLFAGVFVAFYVLSVTFIAPKFGVGNAIFFVLIGQMISAAAIDHFGLFGANISPLTLTRAAGLGLMAAGVWLTQVA
ncbi:DMT family transporter [Cognatishimia maritima]|uniref:Transporter family-2 protein n=1 Tax=Cognatishimia maritima TaxID=870908 RepID=A0A1M5JPW7_9RHOB|nr:DMT family transporter [Cognatishimia maritima]SHG42607.1 transporter family-2 protein [Cognatishimia maritima]